MVSVTQEYSERWSSHEELMDVVFSASIDLPMRAKAIAGSLSIAANEHGHVVASIETISGWIGCNPRTTMRALKDLQEAGIVTRIAGGYGRTASWYQLHLPR